MEHKMNRKPQDRPKILTNGLASVLNSKTSQGAAGYLNSSPHLSVGVKSNEGVANQHRNKVKSMDLKTLGMQGELPENKKAHSKFLPRDSPKWLGESLNNSIKTSTGYSFLRKSSNETGGRDFYVSTPDERKALTAQEKIRRRHIFGQSMPSINFRRDINRMLSSDLQPFTREMLKSAGEKFKTKPDSLIDEHYSNIFEKLDQCEVKDFRLSEEIYFTPEQQKFIKERSLKANAKGKIQIFGFEEGEEKNLSLDADKGVYFRIHTENINFPLKFSMVKESGICEIFCSSHDIPTREKYESKYISSDFSINYNRFHPNNITLLLYAYLASQIKIKFRSYKADFYFDDSTPRKKNIHTATSEGANKLEANLAGSEIDDDLRPPKSPKQENILRKNIQIAREFQSRKIEEIYENQMELERKMLKVKFKREKNMLIKRNETILKALKKETKKDEMLSKLKEIQQTLYKRIWWAKWIVYIKILIISSQINQDLRGKWKHHMVGFKEKLDILSKVWDEQIFKMLNNENYFLSLLGGKLDSVMKANPKFQFGLADLQNISVQEKVLSLTLHLNKSYNLFYRELSKYLSLTKDLNKIEGNALKFVNTVQDRLEAQEEDNQQQAPKPFEKKNFLDKEKFKANTKAITNKQSNEKIPQVKKTAPSNAPKIEVLEVENNSEPHSQNNLLPDKEFQRSRPNSRLIKKPHIEIQSSPDQIDSLILEVLIQRRKKELEDDQKSKSEIVRKRTVKKKGKKKKIVKISPQAQQAKENSAEAATSVFVTDGLQMQLRKKNSMASEYDENYQAEEIDEWLIEGDQEDQQEAPEALSRPGTRSIDRPPSKI